MLNVKELIPWRSGNRGMPARQEGADPFGALQTDINRAFESFWRGVDFPLMQGKDAGFLQPSIDYAETEKAVEIKAELPGLDPKDVEVTLANGALTIRGHKKAERETTQKGYVLRERSYGTIERTVPLPEGLDVDAAQAVFKNGVLALTIPKTSEAQAAVRRISVKQA